MPVVNKKFMFPRVYDSPPNSVFDRVGVLRELLCVRYGYCYQTLLSMDEVDLIQIKSIYLPAQYRKTRLNMKPLIIQT